MISVCFRHGVEVGNHKSAHKFRFMDAGGYVALQDDRMNGWTIMELHRLLMSVEKCQIGNWKDVSCSVRTRSSKSCEKLFSTLFTRQTFGRLCWEKAKKRWKSNFRSMRWNVLHKPPRKNPRLTSSQLQSLTYDKNRDEYECEALNDAEAWLTDAYSDPDGDKYFLALKALQVDLVAKNVFVRNRMRKAADKHDLGREFFGFGRLDYRPGCGTASSAGASEVSFVVRDAVKKEEW
ncbi:unnamed protein product [Notodromas monacha]|uniref:Transcriptional adapter 2-alpha/beta-like domain-containing protein n=1 Tax=Notodromas monacha TaxID=399045 RepID=A0A7R9BP09_9CRUS|nr:unnamed protein product [Notodromas monacha]CAG0917940.1 unnamed protein product [Notodromas monacha]